MIASCSGSQNKAAVDECKECETELSDVASTSENTVGDYLCTVAEKASIESIHLEGADPPKATKNFRVPARFKMRITQEKDKKWEFRLVELPYEGADRDPTEWHTRNSVLHSPYVGNGERFSATEKDTEGFFIFGRTVHTNDDGAYSFYHTGFEWPGGVDTNLSVRWGRCKQI